MRVNLTSTAASALSTSLGLLAPGASLAVDVSPDRLFKVASELETLRAAGALTYRVSDSPLIPQPLEVANMESAGTRSADVVILPAAVKTLNATPVALVPAPGANQALIFDGALVYKQAGTAYDGIAAAEDLTIKYTNGSGANLALLETTGFLDQATAQTRWCYPSAAAAYLPSVTPAANAALVVHMTTGEIGPAGTGNLIFRVFYRVVPTVL